MNHTEPIAPIHAKVFDPQVAEAIAHETGATIELATRVYKEELSSLAHGARLTQFVNVLAGRRARMRLQRFS